MDILNEEDVFQITYLTMHGWELEYDGWVKEGVSQIVEESHSCGCCLKKVSTSTFTRQEAFDKQRYELEEGVP